MSDAKGQHEPSMEEILASIRRIIAEDNDSPEGPARGGTGSSAAGGCRCRCAHRCGEG